MIPHRPVHGCTRGLVTRQGASPHRRGAAVVQVAVALPLLLGCVALSLDVGIIYSARTQLQRTADASALAAAKALGEWTEGNALEEARLSAAEFAVLNHVNGQATGLAASDVVFGRAVQDDKTRKFSFTETEVNPNAVRVHVRRTADSPSGGITLYFANLFGIKMSDVGAKATAVLTPRDICLAFDLSTSLNDDSSLRSFKNVEVHNRDMWESLWDTREGDPPVDGDGFPEGPKFGNMNLWGDNVTDPSWDFQDDKGLTRLRRRSDWNLSKSWVSQTLSAQGRGSYTNAEMSAINSDRYDGSSSDYTRRVLVALGIYRWKSGKSGGQSGGDGDNRIEANEIEVMVPYPNQSSNPDTAHVQVGGSWEDFVDYVMDDRSSMTRYDPRNQYYGDSDLRYRFGLKTWVDYLQEKQYGNDDSPGLAGTMQQPMGAIVGGFKESLNIIDRLGGNDLVGLASYATYGYGPDDKPGYMSWLTKDIDYIRSRIDLLQPGMWTTSTNIAQGIDECVKVLEKSPEARSSANRVILLLTDGIANRTRDGNSSNRATARSDAIEAAEDAHDKGITVYTISVGSNADTGLMAEIAEATGGFHFHTEGTVDNYTAELQTIFRRLGSERTVMLIE